MALTFLKKKNNAHSTLLSTHTSGSGTIVIQVGDQAKFPLTFPFKITVWDSSLDQNTSTIFNVTSSATNTFTVSVSTDESPTSADQTFDVTAPGKTYNVALEWTYGSAIEYETAMANMYSSIAYPNLVKNSNFNNSSNNGYGNTPDNWSSSSSNAVQGGFPVFSPALVETWTGVLATGCQGFWDLNGNFTDQSSNAYTLTAHNTPTNSTASLMGQAKAFSSASSQYADNAGANLNMTGSQTWVVFCNPATLPGVDITMMGIRAAALGNEHDLTLNGSGNVFSFTLSGLTTNDFVFSDVTATAGMWHMVVGSYDSVAQTLSIWVNGIRKTVAASGSCSSVVQNFSIGRMGSENNKYFNGTIQGGAIYNTAFTDAQVRKLWQNTTWGGIKLRRNATDGTLTGNLVDYTLSTLLGNSINAEVQVYQDTGSIAILALDDGVETVSSTSATTGAWVTLTVNKTVSATATAVVPRLKIGTTNGNAWFRMVTTNLGVNPSYWSPSADDWARFPRLLELNPAPIILSYAQEQNRLFTYVPIFTGFTGGNSPAGTFFFSFNGNRVRASLNSANGVSNATTMTVTGPAAARGTQVYPCARIVDNTATQQFSGIVATTANSAVIGVFKDNTPTAFTNSGGKRADFDIEYEMLI